MDTKYTSLFIFLSGPYLGRHWSTGYAKVDTLLLLFYNDNISTLFWDFTKIDMAINMA